MNFFKGELEQIAIIEPMAHSPGHYSHFLKKMIDVFSSVGYDVNVFIGPSTTQVETSTAIKTTVNDRTYNLIYKVSHVRWLLRYKRVIYIDIISTIALRTASRENKNIFFLSTFYFLPYLYFIIFLKNTHNVKFYRFNHHYFNKKIIKFFSKIVFKKVSKNIFFQSTEVQKEFNIYTKSSAGYLPIPIILNNFKKMDQKKWPAPGLPSKKSFIEILIFGINHISKDTHTFFSMLQGLPKHEKKKIRLIVAGVQIEHGGRVTGEHFKKMHDETVVINRRIQDEEKIYLFQRVDYCFAGFKKEFKSSSGVLVDCVEFQVPFISTNHQELAKLYEYDENFLIYDAGDVTILSSKMQELINKNSSLSNKKPLPVPSAMTLDSFIKVLNFDGPCEKE